jgi:BASS family bile acid:Na+ symporter
MFDILSQSIGILIAIFLFTALLSVGLSTTVQHIADALRDKRLTFKSLFISVFLPPLLAVAITAVIPMEDGLRAGILLFAVAAGVEAGPKVVQLIRGNAAFALGLLTLQLIITITFLPFFVSLVSADADIPRGALILKLSLVIALPLGLGLIINARDETFASRLNAIVHLISVGLLATVFLILVYLNFNAIRSLQSGAVLAGLLFFVLAFVVGYLFGGPATENRRALAVMTFARSGGICIMIANQVFAEDPEVLLMTTLMAAGSLVVAVLVTVGFRGIDSLASMSPKAR